MDLKDFAWIGISAAVIAPFWGYIKTIFYRFKGLFVVRASIRGRAAIALTGYCWKYGKVNKLYNPYILGFVDYIKSEKKRLSIGMEIVGQDDTLFWLNRVPLLIKNEAGTWELNNIASSDSQAFQTVSLTFIRGTINLDDLMEDALHYLNGLEGKGVRKSRYTIYFEQGKGSIHARNGLVLRSEGKEPDTGSSSSSNRNVSIVMQSGGVRILKYSPDDIGLESSLDYEPFENFIFDDSILTVVDEISNCIDNKEWFQSKHIPWRRGYLLQGKPGNGKSTFVRCLSQKLDLPLFVFDISSMSNSEFRESWRKAMDLGPSVVLIEDIDRVFDGDRNTLGEQGGGLSFDCILNCISGVYPSDGIFLFITTNHPEKLDPALGVSENGQTTRPGRLDRQIEFSEMSLGCRERLAKHILSDFPEEIDRIVVAGDGDSAAQFSQRCSELASKLFWEKKTTNKG